LYALACSHDIIFEEVTNMGAKCRKIFKIGKPFEKKVQSAIKTTKEKKAD